MLALRYQRRSMASYQVKISLRCKNQRARAGIDSMALVVRVLLYTEGLDGGTVFFASRG